MFDKHFSIIFVRQESIEDTKFFALNSGGDFQKSFQDHRGWRFLEGNAI
jgi:hypothetical protein